jgi:hypothetical protein
VLNRDEDATVSAEEGNPGHEEIAAVPDEVDASDGLSELGGEGPSDDGDGDGVLVPDFEADGSTLLGLVGTPALEGRNELCADEPDKTGSEDGDGHGVLDSETNVPELVETDELDNVQAVVVLDSPGGQVEVSVERVLDVRTSNNKMEKRT